MVAEEYLGRSRLLRRLKSGPHGQLIELYAARLVNDGLARHGARRCLNLVGDLLTWITRSRARLANLDERLVGQYLKRRARKQCIQPDDRAALKRLLSVLHDAGMIASAPQPPITLSCEMREMVMRVCQNMGVELYTRFRSEREDWVQAMVMAI